MDIAIGPFSEYSYNAGKDRMVFAVRVDAGLQVPPTNVELDPARILALYRCFRSGTEYHVVYRCTEAEEPGLRRLISRIPGDGKAVPDMHFLYFICLNGHRVDGRWATYKVAAQGYAVCDCGSDLFKVADLRWFPKEFDRSKVVQGDAPFMFTGKSALYGFRLLFGTDVQEAARVGEAVRRPLFLGDVEHRSFEWRGNTVETRRGFGVLHGRGENGEEWAAGPGIYEEYVAGGFLAYKCAEKADKKEVIRRAGLLSKLPDKLRESLAESLYMQFYFFGPDEVVAAVNPLPEP